MTRQAELSVWIDKRPCCQFRLTTMTPDISTQIASDDPAVGLRAVGALRRLAEQLEARHVRLARARGWSWEEIGDALGVSKQSIHAKHGKGDRSW
jgi:hypothetical protein